MTTFFPLKLLDVSAIRGCQRRNHRSIISPPPRFNTKTFLDEIDFSSRGPPKYCGEQDNESFLKLTIKVRDKIVADGLEDGSFDVTDKGVHVNVLLMNVHHSKHTLC